jgi:hypothetical protein
MCTRMAPAFPRMMNLKLLVKVRKQVYPVVTVNGKPVNWKAVQNPIGDPLLEITLPKQAQVQYCHQLERN